MTYGLTGVELFDFSMDNEPPPIKINSLNLENSPPSPENINLKQQPLNIMKNETRFHCEICNTYMNSKCVYDQHLVGKQHLKKISTQQSQLQSNTTINTTSLSIVSQTINKPEVFSCKLCSVNAPSKEQIDTHLSGKRHMNKVAVITAKKLDASNKIIENNTMTPVNTSPLSLKSEQKKFMCDICNLPLLSKEQLDMHLLGKKHKSKVTKLSSISGPSTVTSASSINVSKKTTEDEEMFAHLNIAWDKYKIVNQTISEPRPKNIGEEYEFYCPLCKKFMQRKLQLVDHLKSKKHHKKIYEKRIQNTKPPTTLKNLPKKLFKKGLNKRPIQFVNSTSSITLQSLKARQSFQSNDNSYPQPNQIYDFQTNQSNRIQAGQISIKSPSVQYGAYKRKSPDLNDNCISDNYFDAKYRKNNDSIPVGTSSILSNNNLSNNTGSSSSSIFNHQINTELIPGANVNNSWEVHLQPGQSSSFIQTKREPKFFYPTISNNQDYPNFLKFGIYTDPNYMQYGSSNNTFINQKNTTNNKKDQSY